MKYKIDWDEPRPEQRGFDEGWLKTDVLVVDPPAPALAEVERSLRKSHINGGARVAQFHVTAAASVAWVMSRNRFGEFNFFSRLFSHPVVLATMPEAANAAVLEDKFKMEETFTSFGRLAGCLARGGAYERFSGSDEDAWALTTHFAQAAVGFRIRDCSAWVSWRPWSPWFCDVAWDASFFWFDPAEGMVTLLLLTDTD